MLTAKIFVKNEHNPKKKKILNERIPLVELVDTNSEIDFVTISISEMISCFTSAILVQLFSLLMRDPNVLSID